MAAVEPVAFVAEAPAPAAYYEEPMAAAPAPHHEAELPLVQPAAAVAAAPVVAAVPPPPPPPPRTQSQHDWRLSTRPAPVSRPAAAVASRSEAARSPNIFQRITGLVGGGRPPGPAAALQVEPVIGTRPADAPAPAPTPLRPVASAQPKIAGLDSADRAKAARDEDDLQIPAFLRRQAN